MKKIIYDITPFTTVDYKDHLSCIAWFISCNMRCLYCYNPNIVNSKSGEYTIEDLIDFLKKRVGLLDAVVLSGGEATNHNLVDICNLIKELGYKIKLDTNGFNPKMVEKLISFDLIDYIALDYKAPAYKFKEITKTTFNEKFFDTLDLLVDKNFAFEVRTTVHSNLLNENDINKIILDLKNREYQGIYYLQKYLHVDDTLGFTNEATNIFDKTLLFKDLIPIEFRNY
ncbi:anaerobic ribonucleoside-triphosphate reductase activating protein [Halarcobacter anaerophilus]|uniref:Anaerobic ribonucleoside-triphosphate reductase activating protein n=1 Tax=Halarcobacter anaerophilus TaxID=877500 RepID=A0A4Q0Y0L1_9BACT|nr:anaerobic ribonucleoside-triphosphate reductase activating protein [Halarcobacter anaerophilus]QDF28932.1 anaerobic ribonucleoside triphosphate reductase activating protein [Halarcobacter anaerophilus]RXJ63570.1 anaerobic ribonucleoside-triphosphate reductase activating protein [Halarcobacter anaerophilus]